MFVYILYRFIICTAIISFLRWLKISATAGYIFKAKIHFSLNIEILTQGLLHAQNLSTQTWTTETIILKVSSLLSRKFWQIFRIWLWLSLLTRNDFVTSDFSANFWFNLKKYIYKFLARSFINIYTTCPLSCSYLFNPRLDNRISLYLCPWEKHGYICSLPYLWFEFQG